ncbi:YeeE/YedE family protein [Shewanella marina]|uniref:YeeE/YedE family protein n=1 Tax=Shewanella marina TaxID=487319 RepID=UPI00046EABD6|nr:YeeE/YedE family protein [Shewanella marina]
MTDFTPISALLGGALLGISALLLLLFNGKIAGISGMLNAAFSKQAGKSWRISFLIGLMIAPLILSHSQWQLPQHIETHWITILIAGLLVGIGTRIGSGCTSGHGVCGLGRLSTRSLVATITFMSVAVLTVFITQLF